MIAFKKQTCDSWNVDLGPTKVEPGNQLLPETMKVERNSNDGREEPKWKMVSPVKASGTVSIDQVKCLPENVGLDSLLPRWMVNPWIPVSLLQTRLQIRLSFLQFVHNVPETKCLFILERSDFKIQTGRFTFCSWSAPFQFHRWGRPVQIFGDKLKTRGHLGD